jgi:hypothetical protein
METKYSECSNAGRRMEPGCGWGHLRSSGRPPSSLLTKIVRCLTLYGAVKILRTRPVLKEKYLTIRAKDRQLSVELK